MIVKLLGVIIYLVTIALPATCGGVAMGSIVPGPAHDWIVATVPIVLIAMFQAALSFAADD